jgi:hypothetical protein
VLEAIWKRVLDAWDDDRTHAALLDHAIRSQALPEIAGRYRALGEDPEKGLLAKKRLDAIVLAATQMLMTTKTPKPGKTPLPIAGPVIHARAHDGEAERHVDGLAEVHELHGNRRLVVVHRHDAVPSAAHGETHRTLGGHRTVDLRRDA